MSALELRLVRRDGTQGFTGGRLLLDGNFFCYTLEDEQREIYGQPVASWKVAGKTAIPRGHYRVVVTTSPRFKRRLPLLLNVPGYDGIRIHPGNTATNTEGCILVGDEDPSDGFMGQSVKAFDRLFLAIEDAITFGKEVWIQVS